MALLLMTSGFLAQNYSEWCGGGPLPVDHALTRRLIPRMNDRVRATALILVSVLVPILLVIAVFAELSWLVVAIAAALAANALLQLAVSLLRKQVLPGTLSGMFLMLPPSCWVIVIYAPVSHWTALPLGPLMTGPLLLTIWWAAARLERCF